MFAHQAPLKVILNPAGLQEGFPGETLNFYVVVINQGHQGAVIDVFLDDRFSQTLSQWCPHPRERLALGPQQSGEVPFQFAIPYEALPGTYDYTLVVDAPEQYPEHTQQFPRQLKILIKEQTVVRFNDPTFSLSPATNPKRPIVLKPGQPLVVTALVNNRANRVDRFRLHCLDLDEAWFAIKYPVNELRGPGLLSESSGLELNPGTQGQITFELLFPNNAPAGNYSPTVRLYSTNSPELVLLDLIYLQVPAAYTIDVEFQEILSKVSHKPGQYLLQFTNRGNLLRELTVSARSRDEDELCQYEFDPASLRLLMGKTVDVGLTVTPTARWRRPLFGYGLQLNFQIELEDLQGYPVPERLPQGTLLWKARPWWQFLLVLLAGLLGLAGLGFLIWFTFFRPVPPPELADFSPDNLSYTEGDRIRLNWRIEHGDQLKQLKLLTTKNDKPQPPMQLDLKKLTQKQGPCVFQAQELTCSNIETAASAAGKYTFTLQVVPRSGKPLEQKLAIEIAPKPTPEILNFAPNQAQYKKGDRLTLSWNLKTVSYLSELEVIAVADDGIQQTLGSYQFNQNSQPIPANLTSVCKAQNEELTCEKVEVALPAAGTYSLQLNATSTDAKPAKPANPVKIQVQAIAPKIVSFTLNGQNTQQSPTVFLAVGQSVNLRWQVQGENLTVTLEPFGNVPARGSKTIQATTSLTQVVLTATNPQGQSDKRAFLVQAQEPTVPSLPTAQPHPKPTKGANRRSGTTIQGGI
jgi:hypothetical protein